MTLAETIAAIRATADRIDSRHATLPGEQRGQLTAITLTNAEAMELADAADRYLALRDCIELHRARLAPMH